MPLSGNRLGWMVTKDIRGEGVDGERNFRFSEWGPDAAIVMCNEVRHFRSPYGGTIGDIIDSTPKDLISKVMLEDKVSAHELTLADVLAITNTFNRRLLTLGTMGEQLFLAMVCEIRMGLC